MSLSGMGSILEVHTAYGLPPVDRDTLHAYQYILQCFGRRRNHERQKAMRRR